MENKNNILFENDELQIVAKEKKPGEYLNIKKTIEDYTDNKDWRINENSTTPFSVGANILYNSGAVVANYWLNEVYDKEIAKAHRNCEIHIHDLSFLGAYCMGWSLKDLIMQGLGGVTGKITSAPAKHLSALCNQMVNFFGILQNEAAGAQAFSSFDTYLAPFVKVDKLSYDQVKQCIQNFIYGVNTPSRWGGQAPFTNVTIDWTCPDDLAELPAIVGGKEQNFKYKDCQKEMDMVNKAFIEIMIEGDANGRGFQYPIPTYSITKDFDWSETENNKLLFEMASKYGIPYFSNYVNSDISPSDIRSMCITEDSMIWCKLNGKTKHITIKELYNSTEYSKQILTRFGYRDIKELQRFEYKGDLLKFTTETGKQLTSTIDHEHVIFNKEKFYDKTRKWITNGNIRKWISVEDKIPNGFIEIEREIAPSGRTKCIIKKKAFELEIGDYFTCRTMNPGEGRKGKCYEDIYGEKKSKAIKDIFHKQRIGREAWNKGMAVSDEIKDKISKGCQGHYVSENCKQKSSERWAGLNNPIHQQEYWDRNHIGSCLNSPYEFEFMEELDSLGYVLNKDYIHQYCIDKYISDFYMPEKNLVIELETNFLGCSYNNSNYRFCKGGKESIEKYEFIKSQGYNLLVFNPKDGTDSYRQYINACEKIVNIERIPFDGYVYDLEVDCEGLTMDDVSMYHTFYANEILTGNCCRLRLDLRELRKKSGGFFGSGENTGSIGVVTLNMPRLAFTSTSKEEFFEKLTKLMDLSARSLKIKRNKVNELLEKGFYPYTKRYLGHFNNHFSTIGLVGMNECCLNARWVGKDLTNKKAVDFTKEVLNFMLSKLQDYQEQYGDLYNLEATPAESTSYRFAKHDKEKYKDIITANMTGTPYYTNSSHLPVGSTDDIFKALDIQDELQTLYTSGTVFHTFLGEKLPDWRAAASLVKTIANNYKLPYFTLSPTYSVCKDHGYIAGEVYKCPVCGNATEVNSRITGYYRPVQNWNVGKKQEFEDRSEYQVSFNDDCKSCKIDTKGAEVKNKDLEKAIKDAKIVVSDKTAKENKAKSDIELFTTKSCPNCVKAKELLDDAKVKYIVRDSLENVQRCQELNIVSAPTLLVKGEKYSGVSNIIKWLEDKKG